MTLIVDAFLCRTDNIGYLAHDTATGATAAIDAPDAETIIEQAEGRGWTISDVLVTHHHFDHTDGIPALKERYGATVTGPASEAEKIGVLDRLVDPGDEIMLGSVRLEVFGVPGHTLGHIAYFDPAGMHLFTGDALFSLGCGRMFEGTPGPMWEGLARLRALPDDVLIYCGHEYTQANGRFALSIDPANQALVARVREADQLRAAGSLTVPVPLGQERKTNPFLRADDPDFAAMLNLDGTEPSAVFAHLRAAKDMFRG